MLRYIMVWLLLAITLLGLLTGSYWYVVVRPQQASIDSEVTRKAAQTEGQAMSAYKRSFAKDVHKFAMLNRIDQSVLHRDKHADCYIRVVMYSVINQDGGLEAVSVAKSSGVPIVDKYFTYVIEQAAPYQPLVSVFSNGRKQVSITHEFALDARLYNDKKRSKRPCDAL